MIDEMKGLCQTNGLSNQASEEVVITSVFLYKFLNDKFMANMKEFAKDMGMSAEEILQDEDMLAGFYDTYPQDVAFKYEDTIPLNKNGKIQKSEMVSRDFLQECLRYLIRKKNQWGCTFASFSIFYGV